MRDEPLEERLATLRARIVRAAREAGRPADSVTLVAVSKGQPPARIAAAIDAGLCHFGENRVQEAALRWPPLRPTVPALTLALIGRLQTNKAADAIALFDEIHTLDRTSLAEALAGSMAKYGRRPACFIQVNTGAEPQKAGIAPEAADAFIEDCRTRLGLPVVGLMCLPPAADPPAPHFAFLRQIARRHGLAQLSMGMSADFETAIALGATHVRIGTALFGVRPAATV